jgi:membrane-associated phospholipid phosphatase
VLCWAALVAVSRLALGRHFLTDVMGGLTLGALEFWATFLFLQRFVFTA